jgi:hypothetical protein
VGNRILIPTRLIISHATSLVRLKADTRYERRRNQADEGVIEGRRGECFPPQPLARDGIVLAAGAQKLDGDAPLELRVLGEIDFAHPTGAKGREDAVTTCQEIHQGKS